MAAIFLIDCSAAAYQSQAKSFDKLYPFFAKIALRKNWMMMPLFTKKACNFNFSFYFSAVCLS